MATITKKELIDRISGEHRIKRTDVKRTVQAFLDHVIAELGKGNRLEFRDFGVFEPRVRAARRAQNPKTLDPVQVPERTTVKFKVGRILREHLDNGNPPQVEAPVEVKVVRRSRARVSA
jgi:integration host factor subunit beta